MPDIGKYPQPGSDLKAGRKALPGNTILSPSRKDVTALKDYLISQKTASLKTLSTNIILDSEMVLNQATLSVFFEKIAANFSSKPLASMPKAVSSPASTTAVASKTSVPTQQTRPQTQTQGGFKMTNMRKSSPLPQNTMSYGSTKTGGSAKIVKQGLGKG